jgi:hypothetical protein
MGSYSVIRRKRKKMAMYDNKMVCCLKANGKVLREHKDTVYVPFGTEYSVQLKNLNSKRTLVKVEIDGVDTTGRSRLVVNPNEVFELTRFIKNGNLKEGNRFKFIERTAGIEKHRGVGMEDGIIRIEFQFERVVPAYISPYDPIKIYYRDPGFGNYHVGDVVGTNAAFMYAASASDQSVRSYAPQAVNASLNVNDAGITVPGSVSSQSFTQIKDFPVESEKFVMVLKLLGETETGKLVLEPVTVKTKPKCVTCGRVNKSGAKFCTDCGTALEIV